MEPQQVGQVECVGCRKKLSTSDPEFLTGEFLYACCQACVPGHVRTLDDLAELLEPGQSFVVGRPSAEQQKVLTEAELEGSWAITVAEPGGTEGEECTLFAENDRTVAIKRAWFYLAGKNGKRESAE